MPLEQRSVMKNCVSLSPQSVAMCRIIGIAVEDQCCGWCLGQIKMSRQEAVAEGRKVSHVVLKPPCAACGEVAVDEQQQEAIRGWSGHVSEKRSRADG